MEDRKSDIAGRTPGRRRIVRRSLVLAVLLLSLTILVVPVYGLYGVSEQRDVPRSDGDGAAAPAPTELPACEERTVPIEVWVLTACGSLAGLVLCFCLVKKQSRKERSRMQTEEEPRWELEDTPVTVAKAVAVGQLHNIGARAYQEDSFGVTTLQDGLLAVVADGMGGLSGGDIVSQKVVFSMLELGDLLPEERMDGALESMVYTTNEAVNAMLGVEGLYRSGSTLLAVLVRKQRFHWIAVGDSHICLYRNGQLIQLNEEHNRGQELLHMAQKGEITYEEAQNAPGKRGLTSFIGMGRLRYVDKSRQSVALVPGDRIILMTDGVFETISDETIASVLAQYPDVSEAASELERKILEAENPRQDNFTAVILSV